MHSYIHYYSTQLDKIEIYAGWLHINICQHTISYRDTALAILSEKDGLMALKIPTPLRLLTRRNKKPTPLHLMVKEMPGETVSHAKDLNSLPYPCNYEYYVCVE